MDVGTIFVWIMYIAKAKPLPLFFDKKGKKYGRGKGFIVYVDDKCLSHTTRVQKVVIR
mgnify:CR=1 FL=1